MNIFPRWELRSLLNSMADSLSSMAALLKGQSLKATLVGTSTVSISGTPSVNATISGVTSTTPILIYNSSEGARTFAMQYAYRDREEVIA